MAPKGQIVCLIKPQFEAGREKVGKKGVVRDKGVHREVIEKVMEFALSLGFSILHLEYSPIKGPEGNIEYLLHLEKGSGTGESGGPACGKELPEALASLAAGRVDEAHQALD